ncbi:hypothetical protein [Flavobacterium sp.]|uniref:hypothetical protein n=1 Tax=Flavobacterium sp. TaxID=239 RepID=UPI0026265C9B|nr:hypothetical protein [Flavobacterium sp.]
MSKTNHFKINNKRILEYLKSLESVLDEVKSENINDRLTSDIFKRSIGNPSNFLNKVNDDFSILGSQTYMNQDFFNLQSSYNKKLEDLDFDELLAKLSTYSCCQIEFRKILSLINKKRFALWLEKIIRKLKKMLKLLNNNSKIKIQNKRDIFRKIYCFFFKNLDDTHATIIFN